GTQLNKILRHYIGRPGRNETRKKYIKCNEGGWVLLEDLLSLDFIWKDDRYYRWEEEHDRRNFLVTRKERIGLIVELTVAEYRLKGKTRFQIMGLVAEDQGDLDAIVHQYKIPKPQTGTNPFEELYGGWIMPVAVRATSGHSKDIQIPLEPASVFKTLDLDYKAHTT
ncbi:MAG: hypothetical protein OIF58_13200, partial [Cohaesibacter sp.]|nr:hypothetical protein [Cohaesibacter sp.]